MNIIFPSINKAKNITPERTVKPELNKIDFMEIKSDIDAENEVKILMLIYWAMAIIII